MAAALVDRLLHHGQVYYLKGDSYRIRGKPRFAEAPGEGTVSPVETGLINVKYSCRSTTTILAGVGLGDDRPRRPRGGRRGRRGVGSHAHRGYGSAGTASGPAAEGATRRVACSDR